MNAKDVLDLCKELEATAGKQAAIDAVPDGLLGRTRGVQTGTSLGKDHDAKNIRRMASGMASQIIDQQYDLHSTTPRLTANSPDKTADNRKEEIEAGLAGCWLLSAGETDVWLDQVFDVDTIGRGWSFICHNPSKWSGAEFKPNMETYDRDEVAGDRKRRDDLKADHFPIIWRYVDGRNVLWTPDERGAPDQVVEKLRMTARQARRAYGIDTGDMKDSEFIELYRYGDDKEVMTVANRTGGYTSSDPTYAKEPWEHGLGINPYLLARGRRRAPGDLFHGALFHAQDMIDGADAMLSDAHWNAQQATRAALVVETTDAMSIDPLANVPIKLEADKITAMPPGVTAPHAIDAPRTNVDIFALHGIYTALTRSNLSATLAGITSSGQSGALFNSSVQIAQRAHSPNGILLERAAVGAGVRFLRAIAAMGDPVPIYYTDAGGKVWKLDLDARKVAGWDRTLQATIEFGIPFNQNAQAELARLLTQGDEKNAPLVARETAMAEYLKIANPADNERRIRINTLTAMLLEPAFQIAVANFMKGTGDVPAGLENEITAMPPAVQQAIEMRRQRNAGQTGGSPNGTGQLARTAANGVREGVAPQPYDMGQGSQMVP